MFNTSIQALDGKGEPPSQAEAQRVKRLRAVADDLFQLAMAQMGEAAVMARNAGRGGPGPHPWDLASDASTRTNRP
jgi:hypothetical protein